MGNCGDWNFTYNYYHDNQRIVEIRDGSGQVFAQQVWSLTYVDELVQNAVNQDPSHASAATSPENEVTRAFWIMQDANYNVLGAAYCLSGTSGSRLDQWQRLVGGGPCAGQIRCACQYPAAFPARAPYGAKQAEETQPRAALGT